VVELNTDRREITAKVVYYGAAMSGKTTNLRALRHMAPPGTKGRLLSLETHDDRTLFFDLLPMRFHIDKNTALKLRIFTVPGQPFHRSTRKIVLRQADAIVFVADSQLQQTEANKDAFNDLRENIEANQLPADIPLVVQFNKQDLPNVRSSSDIDAFGHRVATPTLPAIAIDGSGVRETLEAIIGSLWSRLSVEPDVIAHFGRFGPQTMAHFFDGWHQPTKNIGANG